jgi:hypothetical protein
VVEEPLMRPFKSMNKYGAKRTNGYASKRESEYAEDLRLRKLAENGDVRYWLEQVPVKLSIGKLTIDFLVFKRDGSHQYVEVKGKETRDFKLRMIALQNERPEIWKLLEVVS